MSVLTKAERSDVAAGAMMGGLLGALGITTVLALVVAFVAMSGGVRPTITSPTISAPTAMPANMPGTNITATQGTTGSAQKALAPAKATTVKTIALPASAVAPAITRTSPASVRVDLETREVVAEVAPGQTYTYWTFNGTIPGPMLRVRVGDTVELRMKNATGSAWPHSIDLHAVNGPGGGATATQTGPGQETMVTWKALNPGLFVYHCASAPIPMHIANGMYGMILVEPEGGLPPVDREFYVMQGELYTDGPIGMSGHHDFNQAKMDNEEPDYVIFNGKVGSLTGDNAMTAKVGETIRIFFGVGGFLPSSLHLIGEIFDRVYPEGAVGSAPNRNVQTTLVPAGGATIVELHFDVPGSYTLVDHALPRALGKGAAAQITVTGDHDISIYSGPLGGGGH
jgi:nitrite reductase (NO-forming)